MLWLKFSLNEHDSGLLTLFATIDEHYRSMIRNRYRYVDSGALFEIFCAVDCSQY